jgi:predicted nucleic acid-binding Zn ribbon protein
MRKSNTQKISEVILDCLRDMQIDRKLKEVQLVTQWESMMGKTVANRTSRIYIKNGILYIHVTSSVLKSELLMMRGEILEKLNEKAGERMIEEIVIR